jgi:hypothetical protein
MPSAKKAPIGSSAMARIAVMARTNFSRASSRWTGEEREMDRSRSS